MLTTVFVLLMVHVQKSNENVTNVYADTFIFRTLKECESAKSKLETFKAACSAKQIRGEK